VLQRNLRWLVVIVILSLLSAYVDWPNNPGIHIDFAGIKIDRDLTVREGLDLQGGMQVMLEADVPADQEVTADQMEAARTIVENRVNGLGVSEPLIQLQGERRMIVELPGVDDPERAIQTFGQTGLLEFIDAGSTGAPVGEYVTTSLGGPDGASGEGSPAAGAAQPTTGAADATTPGATAGVTTTESATATAPISPTAPTGPTDSKVYPTVMTGRDLSNADIGYDEFNRPEINFTLHEEGAKKFADFTKNNVGRYLAITLDKKVISSPVIQSPITEGRGRITGRFTLDEARSLVIQLKYGSLPIPLKVIQNRTVGPTLGLDSVQRSINAGIIGLALVMIFMIVYYRLPGLLANLALIVYTLLVFALFKFIPVVLTLAGIAGFVLSIGMAVDANILIFERMKEELRSGKTLGAAIEAGFDRAWTSIRDSNISTLITCAILFWFGMNFGASIIKGFALTLAIGVLVSMFTAIVVTRNFLRIVQQVWFAGARPSDGSRLDWLFGLHRLPERQAPDPVGTPQVAQR
jgi:preprotein translocase subunit SecD